jgi:hypothetical protein
MADTTHECPTPGCEERVPFERFACRAHWYSLPPRLRTKLNAAWRFGTADEHVKVRAECVKWLEKKYAEPAPGIGS